MIYDDIKLLLKNSFIVVYVQNLLKNIIIKKIFIKIDTFNEILNGCPNVKNFSANLLTLYADTVCVFAILNNSPLVCYNHN